MKTLNGFDIKFVFLAYVPPYPKEEPPVNLRTEIIENPNKTTDYLFKIFDSAIDEAKVEITFNSDGKQNNNVRTQILSIVQESDLNKKNSIAKKLSKQLYKETDERSGMGLFVIIEGQKEKVTRFVLIRFKGDEGLANQGKKSLVDYIPEVFQKKSKHYKLAVYSDIVSDKSFWKGYSIDKQISANTYKTISIFWIESFLDSKTALTSPQGTLQFSKVIKNILSNTQNIAEQEEIISGIVNLRGKQKVQMSLSAFCKTYLTEKVADKIEMETNNEDFFNSVFEIDSDVYKKEFGKTVLSLQDGITAYIPSFSYKKHVTETQNIDGSKSVKIEGKLQGKKFNVQSKGKKLDVQSKIKSKE